MAKIEFNAAWWKKNSAKTLTDSGMDEALKKWEAVKKVEAAPVLAGLTLLHKAAVMAEKKANKTLHKETIGYLQAYQNKCAELLSKLGKADGSSLATPDKILTKPVIEQIGASKKGKMYVDELMYLFVTKAKPNTVTPAIYKTFFGVSAPKQVNLSSTITTQCETLAEAGTWVDPAWEDARKEIVKLSLTGTNLTGLKNEVLAPIEAEPVLAEIRAA